MFTRLLRAIFQSPPCQRCLQQEATKGDLCVYCYLDQTSPKPVHLTAALGLNLKRDDSRSTGCAHATLLTHVVLPTASAHNIGNTSG